jgi:pyruvate-formate lyase
VFRQRQDAPRAGLAATDIIIGIMERIIVQLESDSLAELDRAAGENNMSRAAFVRAAVDAVLAEGRRRKELKQVADSYRKSPPEDLTLSREALQAVWPE